MNTQGYFIFQFFTIEYEQIANIIPTISESILHTQHG